MVTAVRPEFDLKKSILSILERHVGRNNPVKAVELAEMLDCSKTNTFEIRDTIADLIKDGYPILSKTSPPEGYFIASSYQEVNECCQSLRDRGIKIIIRRRDLIRAAHNHFESAVKVKLL